MLPRKVYILHGFKGKPKTPEFIRLLTQILVQIVYPDKAITEYLKILTFCFIKIRLNLWIQLKRIPNILTF